MLVTKKNLSQAIKEITHSAAKNKALSYDTEFSTLFWWKSPWLKPHGLAPRVFAVQIATVESEYYFDFNYESDRLKDSDFITINAEITQNPEILWFIANAKIDLHQSRNHGIEIAGRIHCTMAGGRVMNNIEPSLSLDNLSTAYLGEGKHVDMAAICKEKGFFTKVKKFGHNDKFEEILHFDKIDQALMVEYGKIDVRRCFDLGRYQIKKILELDEQIYSKLPPQHDGRQIKLSDVLENEHKLTKVFFEMEREGILIDRAYTEEAYEHEVKEYRRIESELDRLASSHVNAKVDWNSAKQLKPIFDAIGEPYRFTEKGNACFDKDALDDSDSEIAKLIIQYRHHYKRAHTYFENFIWFADENNVLHADAQQAGTVYGRPSYWNPNLLNIPKRTDKEEANYKVRRCFIAKPGGFLAEFDFKGAEYYMGMDYARQMDVVKELNAGLDPHKRLGGEMNLERDPAKTMQFRILYGGGGGVVGRALGYKGEEADRIGKQKKREYFKRVPDLHRLICHVSGGWMNGRKITGVAESRGFIFNWLGRLMRFDKNTAYKAFNGLLQGGVGDLTKVSQTRIYDELLPGKRTKMLLQVYDAILFWIPFEEASIVPDIKQIMTTVYPHKVLPMQTDSGFSVKSWADLTDEIPSIS